MRIFPSFDRFLILISSRIVYSFSARNVYVDSALLEAQVLNGKWTSFKQGALLYSAMKSFIHNSRINIRTLLIDRKSTTNPMKEIGNTAAILQMDWLAFYARRTSHSPSPFLPLTNHFNLNVKPGLQFNISISGWIRKMREINLEMIVSVSLFIN